ncbi:MAG TPA: fused MFS/spermidine synthase [Polyangiaceae bacterium]|nr:fused MFS/spermidine synthase [Polyangiaceae bacterium]
MTTGRFRGLVLLFLLSGGAGLVDQVCFSKYFSYVVGATAYAASSVLAAFMTGLTLGAAFGGRLSARVKRPLVAYGVAELVVALAVCLVPLEFSLLTPLYVSVARAAQGSLATIQVARWALAMLLVVVPTTAMGATLPLVSAALASGRTGAARTLRERRLGALYAANTFGGAIGALAGAYLVLPALGLSKTLYAAAVLSAVAGAIAIFLGRSRESTLDVAASPGAEAEKEAEARATASGALSENWLLVLSFASGGLAFTVEVVTTHVLAVVIGNSAYAFGLILSAFLTCLFLGAALAPALARRLGDAALATSLALTALAIAGTLPLWDELPRLFVGLDDYLRTFESREAMRAAVAFSILVLPATMMGLTFPLILRWAAASPHVGVLVGRLTAINTVGAVFGALATGYVLLPRLGSEKSLLVVLAAFVLLAIGTAKQGGFGRNRVPVAFAATSALIAVAAPRWNLVKLTLGANVYFDWAQPMDTILSVREDVHGGVTTVTLHQNVRTLYTNGKFQGNNGWELKAQYYFAHFPSLFAPRFDDVLIIGLGTGTTAGTLATYPWKQMDLVEISPAIAEAAKNYFEKPNRHVFDDPRFHLILDDARNHLLVHPKKYDLISMELSSVWFAGAASLYSSEYYRLVRDHLAEGGVYQQWVQLHHVYRPVFATLVNTLRKEFPHVALFYGGGQGMLIASMRPLQWSERRAHELSTHEGIHATLPDGRNLDTLTEDMLLVDASLDRFLDDMAEEAGRPRETMVSTDDNLFLEYETPRGNILPWSDRELLVAKIKEYRDADAIAALRTDRDTP